MRSLLATALLLPAPAMAHIGHIADVAGHGYWIALGGIAVAGAIALLGGRKKPDTDAQDADPEDDTTDQEAPA